MAARATNMVFVKNVLLEMDTFNLLFLRFLTGFFLLLPFFGKKLLHAERSTILRGLILGLAFFGMMSIEVTAAEITVSSVLSGLINTAVIIVPLLNAILLRRLPRRQDLICAGIALIGVITLNWSADGIHLHRGECLCLFEAFVYAGIIILTERFSHKEKDAVLLGVIEVGVIGVLSLFASLCFEVPHLPYTPRTWWMIMALAVVCTFFGFSLQPMTQRYLPAERAGLLCAVSPMVVTTLGVLFLNEELTIHRFVGILLIISSLVLLRLPAKKSKESAAEAEESASE